MATPRRGLDANYDTFPTSQPSKPASTAISDKRPGGAVLQQAFKTRRIWSVVGEFLVHAEHDGFGSSIARTSLELLDEEIPTR